MQHHEQHHLETKATNEEQPCVDKNRTWVCQYRILKLKMKAWTSNSWKSMQHVPAVFGVERPCRCVWSALITIRGRSHNSIHLLSANVCCLFAQTKQTDTQNVDFSSTSRSFGVLCVLSAINCKRDILPWVESNLLFIHVSKPSLSRSLSSQ